MAHVSHKLSGSFEGALAGGGDPASSPLYVFGPFLKLIVAAGVVEVTFGASIWLAVLTVATVSAMYRLVMRWITDGSGGSGLNEEEFGAWAVKINAGVTVVEYTLTFLVSIAALVTFVADRLPALDARLLGLPMRTLVAIGFTLVTALLVNRGPKMAARAFGPATGAVLLLLWVMILATIWQRGLHLPPVHLEAFKEPNLHFTLGGYARILALMTGIEVFANLVAAYDGPARERSKKAFGSLLLIMGTTSLTMLVVGPAIEALSNPLDERVSVFTQTMDKLLPAPLAWAGTLIGIAVLLSAAAASAQGIQNLALGLRHRHYVPAALGQPNRFEVAAQPVWLQAGVCVLCFVLFGTREDTYLSLYAAGVFVLLSLTGWAAVKRLLRQLRAGGGPGALASLVGTALAALFASGATLIIFDERLREGAWAYFVLIPGLFFGFGWFRKRLGPPSRVEDRLGALLASSWLSQPDSVSLYSGMPLRNVLLPLDRSPAAEQATPLAQALARAYGAKLTLLSVAPPGQPRPAEAYLADVAEQLESSGHEVATLVREGDVPGRIGEEAKKPDVDLVVMTTDGRKSWQRWLSASVTAQVLYQTTPPIIVLRTTGESRSTRTRFQKLLVALDGSAIAEQVLPWVHELSVRFKGQVVLLSVQEPGDSEEYSAKVGAYLERLKAELVKKGVSVEVKVERGAPVQAILRAADAEGADLLMMVSHGRGGVERQEHVKLGSVVDLVLQQTPCPVFLISALPPQQSAAQLAGGSPVGGAPGAAPAGAPPTGAPPTGAPPPGAPPAG